MNTKYAQSPFFITVLFTRWCLKDIHVNFIFGVRVTCFVTFCRHFNALSWQYNLRQDKSNDRKVTGKKCMTYGFFLNLFFFQFVKYADIPHRQFVLEPLCRAFNSYKIIVTCNDRK